MSLFTLIPLAVMDPALFTVFEVIAAIVWFTAGIGFGVGFRTVTVAAKALKNPHRASLTR